MALAPSGWRLHLAEIVRDARGIPPVPVFVPYPLPAEAHDDLSRWLCEDRAPILRALRQRPQGEYHHSPQHIQALTMRAVAPEAPIWGITWGLSALGLVELAQIRLHSHATIPRDYSMLAERHSARRFIEQVSGCVYFTVDGFWFGARQTMAELTARHGRIPCYFTP